MTSKMTSRQRLNQVLLSVTGEDIRLVGNWERLPGLFGNAEQLAERLAQVPQFERADTVLMRVERDFHSIFGTTFSMILDWRGT